MHDSPSVVRRRVCVVCFPTPPSSAADDILVRACCADSRCVQPGQLFAAIVGPNADGHDFVYEACFRGAGAVLAERYVAAEGRPICVVSDTRAAFGRLCHALAGNPSHGLRVVGVTGTAGKTATAVLIDSILTTAGYRVGSINGLGAF